MKLTEAKLKQMILEAIKNKRSQDFGVPTPDEKLRSDLGDEMFDKIQGADPEQSEMFKQSFDPNYPREIPQESLDEFLAKHGFVPEPTYNRSPDSYYKVYKSKKYHPYKVYVYYIAEENPIYGELTDDDFMNSDFLPKLSIVGRQPKKIRYNFSFSNRRTRFSKEFNSLVEEQGIIDLYEVFDFDLKNKQDREDIESIILGRVKGNIIKALEELT